MIQFYCLADSPKKYDSDMYSDRDDITASQNIRPHNLSPPDLCHESVCIGIFLILKDNVGVVIWSKFLKSL